MKYVQLINLKLLTIANEHENFSANKYENANYFGIFILLAEKISCSVPLSMKKNYNLGTCINTDVLL